MVAIQLLMQYEVIVETRRIRSNRVRHLIVSTLIVRTVIRSNGQNSMKSASAFFIIT